MRRRIAGLALAGLLAGSLSGCGYYGYAPPAPPPPAPPEPRHPPVDPCGAGPLQYLVGRPVSGLPPYGRHEQRVIAQGSYVEESFHPDRLTIVYDENTGRITRVRCG